MNTLERIFRALLRAGFQVQRGVSRVRVQVLPSSQWATGVRYLKAIGSSVPCIDVARQSSLAKL